MMNQVRHISDYFEEWAPNSTQLEYDNSGLLLGSQEKPIQNVLTCLDITEEVIDEAISTQCDLIVAHHPLIFKKLKRIDPDTSQGSMLYKLIREDIAVLAVHTNLDAARSGVSCELAHLLGLKDLRFLAPENGRSVLVRLSIDAAREREVLKVAGQIEESALPHRLPSDGSDNQMRVELRLPDYRVGLLHNKLREQEIRSGSVEILPLEDAPADHGFGMIGSYDEPLSPEEFLAKTKDRLKCGVIRYSGQVETVQKVAVCGGAGVFLTGRAASAGADAYVTADIKYHEFFQEDAKMMLLDVGHYESEAPIIEKMRSSLQKAFPELNIIATTLNTNPIKTYL